MNSRQMFLAHFQTCQRHADRLDWARQRLARLHPFTPAHLEQLDPLDLAVLDQFSVRYSKLQDAMGARLLPALLELIQEPGPLDTFIDKLNRLEKVGAIRAAEQWRSFREMRNQFAHDYPEDPAIQAALLNKAFNLSEKLLVELDHIERFARPYL